MKDKIIGFLKNHYGKLICLGCWLHFLIVELLLRLGTTSPAFKVDVSFAFQTSILMAVVLYGVYSLIVKIDKYLDKKIIRLCEEERELNDRK